MPGFDGGYRVVPPNLQIKLHQPEFRASLFKLNVGWDERRDSQRSYGCRIFAMLGIALLNPTYESSY
ncbi:MAG: hypothetical protein KC477_10495, partial [Oceanospirillaceae bacterium]|nr:hypothetical protein [Oceanospirillaceae bacterium]